MTDLELKKELIQRIIQYEPVSDGLINNLLRKSVAHLEDMLGRLVQDDADERVEAHRQQAQRESQLEAAYVQALRQISLNGRRLTDSEATRNMLESLLNPGETPTLAIYQTLATQFCTKFSWETPPPVKTAADQEAEFVKMCHENLLSLCDANRQMFKDGVALENWAG